MSNELDPLIGQWYSHLDKGQRFYVVTMDGDDNTVEVQYFDSTLEEFILEEWRDLNIELSEPPENWSGPLDVGEQEDLGTDVTDTQPEDWNEPQEDFRPSGEEKLTPEEAPDDELDEGFINEEPLA